MPMQEYEGPAQVQMNGRTLAEATTARARVSGNNRPVVTMKKALAGRSRGPVQSEVSVDNAIPKSGFEADFIDKVVKNADVRITILVGKKRLQFDGWIDDVEVSQSAADTASISFTVIAGPPLQL